MIAIPVDMAIPGVKSSKLFGNVPIFAVYNTKEERYRFIQNDGCDNPLVMAKSLADMKIQSVAYSYMEEGSFAALHKFDIDIYYVGSESKPLYKIVNGLQKREFIKIDKSNAHIYLDLGLSDGSFKGRRNYE